MDMIAWGGGDVNGIGGDRLERFLRVLKVLRFLEYDFKTVIIHCRVYL